MFGTCPDFLDMSFISFLETNQTQLMSQWLILMEWSFIYQILKEIKQKSEYVSVFVFLFFFGIGGGGQQYVTVYMFVPGLKKCVCK